MTIKEKIMEIIKNESIKESYKNRNGYFNNVILPIIINSNEDNILNEMIYLLASQAAIYDTLLDNIALTNNEELIKKCYNDITKLSPFEENEKE